MSFVHLHVHSQMSLLDGASPIASLAVAAAAQGAPGIAITDHGNLFGALDFSRACRKAGVKPIIGLEAYVAPGDRGSTDPVYWGTPDQKASDVSGSGKYTHMTLLSTGVEGTKNLLKLSSDSFVTGMAGKHGRIDLESLAAHSGGLVGTTGCLGGAVATRLLLGQELEALELASNLKDIFAPGHFFVEIMDHGVPGDTKIRPGLVVLAKKLGLKPLTTNDSHYTAPEDQVAHDALLCVQTGATFTTEGRFKFDGQGYHLRTSEEMRSLDGSDFWAKGCDNTLLVCEMVDNKDPFAKENHMPVFKLPNGRTSAEVLAESVRAGLVRLGVDSKRTYQDRAGYELDMLDRMGFNDYFLVVADLISWSKSQGISVGPGRGSAAGCLVAWALGITDIDPIQFDLLFERFLNPERVSQPDIDIDFDDERRAEVIRYVEDKYGQEHVAQIMTIGTMKGRGSLRDAGRVLGAPASAVEPMIKAYPADALGSSMPLLDMFDDSSPRHGEAQGFREAAEASEEAGAVFTLATSLEGSVRQTGVHAAGVIVSRLPITEVAPIFRRAGDPTNITQWDGPSCESVGLLKMDFLGLKTLTVISKAVKAADVERATMGLPPIGRSIMDLGDSETLSLLASGDTSGVFQLEGEGMQSLLRAMSLKSFDDVVAVLALYRPGPMGVGAHHAYARRSTGAEKVEPLHPEVADCFAEVLNPTFGLIVYQEQIQRCAQIMAGYSLGQADLLRRAMGKKSASALAEEFEPFSRGAAKLGFSQSAIQAVWDVMVPFAGYAFNKSHAAAYALISWQTAWLKAHYPEHYMAAFLSSLDDKARLTKGLSECRKMGIEVTPPSIKLSSATFTKTGPSRVSYGLSSISGIGDSAALAICEMEDRASIGSVSGAFSKLIEGGVNSRAIERLIKAGAFDELGCSRRAALYMLESFASGVTAPVRGGESHLLLGSKELPSLDKLVMERECLGSFVSGHPLGGVDLGDRDMICDLQDESEATIRGLVTEFTTATSKKGNQWSKVSIDDTTGEVELSMFGRVHKGVSAWLEPGMVLEVTAKMEEGGRGSASRVSEIITGEK